MIISHKYKFIFIKTKKTAGTSLEFFLSKLCEGKDVVTPIKPRIPTHKSRNCRGLWNPVHEILEYKGQNFLSTMGNFVQGKKYYSHIPAVKVKNRLPKNIWDSYFKFCVERNPWDKALSQYYRVMDNTGGQLTFDQYLKNGLYPHNLHFYTDTESHVLVDRVIKYESLIEELTEVFAMLGIPFNGDLGVRAKSDHRKTKKNYRDEYTSDQKLMIERAFATEIALHGYTF